VAAGIAFVDYQAVGRLHPYVDARGDEFLGRGLKRRAVEPVGYLVVFPCVVIVAFGHLAAVGFRRVGFAFALGDGEAQRLPGFGVGLEYQRLRFFVPGVDHLRGYLLALRVRYHDRFRLYAPQFRPRDFHGLRFAGMLRRVAYFDLHALRTGCERQQGGARNDFANHDVESVCVGCTAKLRTFSLPCQPERQINISDWQILYLIW